MLLALLPRSLARCALACFAVLLAVTTVVAQSPSAADGFNPNIDGNVYVLVMQPDGKLIIGGQFANFTTRDGLSSQRRNLARLNADGTLDASFTPNPDGAVRTLALDPNGKIYIGGDFSAIQPEGGFPFSRQKLARLNADGSVDAAFVVNVSDTLAPQVLALSLQADGTLVVGGSFTSVQSGVAGASVARRNLFRLTSTGAVDTAWDPNPNGMVFAIVPHVSGKIVVGGGFRSFQAAGQTVPTPRNRLARVNADGNVDAGFDPNANNGVTSLAVQRDGKIIVGGHFTTLQAPGLNDPAVRNHLARLNVDGSVDANFVPNTSGSVYEVAVQLDGSVLVGGTFANAWGRGSASTARGNVARFLPDSTLDDSFNPNFNGQVEAFAFQNDGRIIIGGYFTRALPPGSSSGIVRNRLARINADGSLDADFELSAGGRVLTSVQQTDGKYVVGGSFTSVGGETHNYLARLNASGTVDSAYRPNLNGRAFTLAYQASDGKTIVGGSFTTVNGTARNHIARLNADGTLDDGFDPNLNGDVAAIVIQTDGKIVVGGNFINAQPNGATETTARYYILRLNANGTLDTGFDPTANSNITGLVLQSDGKIIATGLFSGFTPNQGTTGFARNFIARINTDGSIDTTYDPNPDGRITALALQGDNELLVGGAFSTFLPNNTLTVVPRLRYARLNADGTVDADYNTQVFSTVYSIAIQSDGKALVGGEFLSLQPTVDTNATPRRYIARVNTDGKVDATFDIFLDQQAGNRVDLLRVQSDGSILVGGVFTSLQPLANPTRVLRRNLVRLASNLTVDQGFEMSAGGSPSGQIQALVIQPDNKIVAVGSFGDLGGAKTTNIARFTAEGVADTSFGSTVAAAGPINSVVVRPNSTIVPSQLGGLAWLTSAGALRTAFAPGSNVRLSGEVYATAVQSDGSLIVAGAFNNLAGTTTNNLIRFTPAGTLDTNFNPNPNGAVTGLVIDDNGRIVIVGAFTLVADTIRNRIARLNPDGTLDTAFDPNASARINSVLILAGKIIVGGAFTSFLPNGTSTSVAVNYLARLNVDGTVDTAYNPNPSAAVNAMFVQAADHKLVIGGSFNSLQPNFGATVSTRNFLARINVDGTVDQDFNPNPNGPVLAIAQQAGGELLVGGGFTSYQPGGTGTSYTLNYVARIFGDGMVDVDFHPTPNGPVSSVVVQSTGGIVFGGTFTTLSPPNVGTPASRNSLARVAPDGSMDFSFNPDINGVVLGLMLRPDDSILAVGNFNGLLSGGTIMAGGSFTSIGGIPTRNLAALSNNGAVSNFSPNPDGAVNALLAQADGRIVVGGEFTNIAGTARNRLARFNADNTLDTTFNPNVTGTVYALALQPDGKILVGGAITSVGGTSNATGLGIVRLNTNGSVDGSFTAPGPGGATLAVRSIAVQSDGAILYVVEGTGIRNTLRRLTSTGGVDGTFAAVQTATGLFSSVALQADGRILLAGDFSLGTPAISRFARLNRDGSLDTSFNPAVDGPVTAVALQADGRPVIGGNFTRVGSLPRVGLARLTAAGNATQILGIAADRQTVLWVRGGVTSELAAVVFERSSDGLNWTTLGNGTRVTNTSNWQLTGATLPSSGAFYLRARGIAPTRGVGSGIYQSAREFNFSSPLSASTSVYATTGAATGSGSNTVVYTFDYFSGVFTSGTGGNPPPTDPIYTGGSRLAVISLRARVAADRPLIAGFVVGGTGQRNVLLRAVGPGLAGLGVTGGLAAPQLRLYDRNRNEIATSGAWVDTPAIRAATAEAGAFPLDPANADAAALVTLSPGPYTVHVTDNGTAGGIALVQAYDVSHASNATGSARFINLSTRMTIETGNNIFVGAFEISGTQPKQMLIRGIGPGLTQFGVTGVAADPILALYNGSTELVNNDNWSAPNAGSGNTSGQISAAATTTGAFALDAASKDAAVVITLNPGVYTVQLRDSAGAQGAAMVELYEIP